MNRASTSTIIDGDILIGPRFDRSGVDAIADARPLGVIPPRAEPEESADMTQSILTSHMLLQKAVPCLNGPFAWQSTREG